MEEEDRYADIPVLPERVPVQMPQLPAGIQISTIEQFRACSDPIRVKILGIIQNQPATAKQLAEQLGATPGAIGHHLRLLEEHGLAQVIARRLVRGVVAKYYTRTARMFYFELSPELVGESTVDMHIIQSAWNELAAALPPHPDGDTHHVAFPHARLSPERARYYAGRLNALLDELMEEPLDEDGLVYGVCVAMFVAPEYLQVAPPAPTNEE